MTRFPRPATLAAVSLVALTGAGCSFTTDQTTELYYQPSDGVEALLGPDVVVTSVLVVARDAESPGNLIARIVNDGAEPASVQVVSQVADVDLQVTVPPGETIEVGPEGDEHVVLDPVGAAPGTVLPMTALLEGGELSGDMLVPIMDDTFDRYADLLPTDGPSAGPTT